MNGKYVFAIPWWVIIVVLVLATPVGLVLLLVKLFAESENVFYNAQKSAIPHSSAIVKTGRGATTNKRNFTAAITPKKPKHTSKRIRVLAIGHFSIAVLLFCVGVGDAIVGHVTDLEKIIGPTLYFLIFGIVCCLYSGILHRREQDTVRYLQLIGEKESISLIKLSKATSYRLTRVKRDVQRIINDGLVGNEAYINTNNLCFMRYHDVQQDGGGHLYHRIISGVPTGLSARQAAMSAATFNIGIEDYDTVIRKLCVLEEAIRDESVSARIRHIEVVTCNIFAYVARNPSKKNQIRMFINYYLPTTLKLLESYSLIERVGVTGQNMREAKENIENTLDTLVAGFKQQFDLLYREESVDISSDIAVLEQMMSRDGLKKNEDFALGEQFTDSENRK